MVVMALLPMLSMVVMQERVAAPSTCTVHAPHCATPHPNFVPVMPSTSRSTQSRGASPSTSTVRLTPLILIVVAIAVSAVFACILFFDSFYSLALWRQCHNPHDNCHRPAPMRRLKPVASSYVRPASIHLPFT